MKYSNPLFSFFTNKKHTKTKLQIKFQKKTKKIKKKKEKIFCLKAKQIEGKEKQQFKKAKLNIVNLELLLGQITSPIEKRISSSREHILLLRHRDMTIIKQNPFIINRIKTSSSIMSTRETSHMVAHSIETILHMRIKAFLLHKRAKIKILKRIMNEIRELLMGGKSKAVV